VDYESHAVALDRNELGALLVAAGLGPPLEHALISLLALNGLRVPEARAPTSSTWGWTAGTVAEPGVLSLVSHPGLPACPLARGP
jgi:hypothetical protein